MSEKKGKEKLAKLSDKEKVLESLREFTSDRDMPRKRITLRSILGGDFLLGDWLRRNVGLIIFIVFLALLYVGNGYVSQQELIEIDNLKKEVEDVKYNALTRSSELLERSRQSHIEDYLNNSKDSTLKIATMPPYVIKIDSAE